MKKGLFWAIVGMLLLASCGKEETSETSLIEGMWYFSPHSSNYQCKYTNKFKTFCRDHNDSISFDEEVHTYDTLIYYGYWEFTPDRLNYFWQYVDGSIKEGHSNYSIGDDYITTSPGYYDILSLNAKRLIIQYEDTTYFYDDDNERQIAYVVTYTERFNSEWQAPAEN